MGPPRENLQAELAVTCREALLSVYTAGAVSRPWVSEISCYATGAVRAAPPTVSPLIAPREPGWISLVHRLLFDVLLLVGLKQCITCLCCVYNTVIYMSHSIYLYCVYKVYNIYIVLIFASDVTKQFRTRDLIYSILFYSTHERL